MTYEYTRRPVRNIVMRWRNCGYSRACTESDSGIPLPAGLMLYRLLKKLGTVAYMDVIRESRIEESGSMRCTRQKRNRGAAQSIPHSRLCDPSMGRWRVAAPSLQASLACKEATPASHQSRPLWDNRLIPRPLSRSAGQFRAGSVNAGYP